MVKFSNVSILATQSSFLDGFPFGQNKDVADGLWNETLSTGGFGLWWGGLISLIDMSGWNCLSLCISISFFSGYLSDL